MELAVPGDTIKIMVVSPENLASLNVKQFRIGANIINGHIILPDCGSAPCRVWNVNYTVAEGDFGPLTFVIDYLDANSRPGMVRYDDPITRGKIVVTSFACKWS